MRCAKRLECWVARADLPSSPTNQPISRQLPDRSASAPCQGAACVLLAKIFIVLFTRLAAHNLHDYRQAHLKEKRSMAKYGKKASKKVEKAMHERKAGT